MPPGPALDPGPLQAGAQLWVQVGDAAALAPSAPVSRWTPEVVAAACPVLAEAAATLTRRLGGETPEPTRAAAE